MKTRILLLLLIVSGSLYSQTFEERYKAFKQAAENDYSDFRDQANALQKGLVRFRVKDLKLRATVENRLKCRNGKAVIRKKRTVLLRIVRRDGS